MVRAFGRHRYALISGAITLLAVIVANLLMPRDWRETLREIAFDLVLAADQRLRLGADVLHERPVIVVDIDRRSLEAVGPWPWPRDTMARTIEAVAAFKPAAIAVDILFAGYDTRSPAALARQLGTLIARPDLTALADTLEDGDKRLTGAIEVAPTVLGFVLDPEQQQSAPSVPVLTRGAVNIDEVWRVAGMVAPPPIFIAAAAGIGTLALPGDADGTVRRVPLLVAIGDGLYPGLAVEAVRAVGGSSAYLIVADPQMLTIGDLRIGLTRDALLRLVPVDQKRRGSRTVSAVDVLDGRVDKTRFAGAIALIGGSAPELGGLRQSATDPLTASVQIQADAIDQILIGRSPQPLGYAMQIGLAVLCGVLALTFAMGFAPLFGAALFIGVLALCWALALALSMRADFLFDPLTPSIGAIAVFVVTSIVSYSSTRRLQARLRRRFEQHLAPAVVRRIVDEPDLVKLRGEKREVTALFTDIESFTAMTHRAHPEKLVAVLDDYVEGVASIIMAHGGMVDKIVGDAVHAFFNAPVDLADHPRRAVECAIALREWTGAFRVGPAAASIGFGRTRVGLETGSAIVGDIGIGSKLDYTAHGDAINMAARLEAANKELGSTICVGPVAASYCDAALFRPLGIISVRGRGDSLAVFEPWPPQISEEYRNSYLAAYGTMVQSPVRAAELFMQLADQISQDPVPRLLAQRLLEGANS